LLSESGEFSQALSAHLFEAWFEYEKRSKAMTKQLQEYELSGEDAFNPDHERSFYKILPQDSKLLLRADELLPQVEKGHSDAEFKAMFGYDKNYSLLRRLRLSFWNLYNEAQGSKQPYINQTRIYSGLCAYSTFIKILNDDLYTTFLLTQPHDVKLIQEDLLYEGYKYLEEILELPVKDKKGMVNSSVIGHKIKIIEMMENRLQGSVVQRAQSYSEEVKRVTGTPESDEDVKKLRDEVAKLRGDLGKELLPEVIEAN
jgi:hypothetical protein